VNRLRREMAEFCEDVIGLYSERPVGPTTGKLASKARGLLSRLEPRISKTVTANQVRRRTKLEEQSAEMTELRRKVFARANGVGELCCKPLRVAFGQLCHLEGGIGRRRQRQSEETCVAEHERCHRSLDRAPLEWLSEVQAWAARHGYPLPERFRKLAALRGVEILAVEKIPKTMEVDAPATPKEER
jgi:hypothetical protein